VNAAQANKILAADLANLVKKVASGKTLTQGERKLLQAAAGPTSTSQSAEDAPTTGLNFVPTQSALAELFGVSRQLISYHCKTEGSPGRTADGRYPVQPWREYLQAFGRVPIDEAVAGGRPRYVNLDYGDACGSAIEIVGAMMIPALKLSGVRQRGKALDKLAINVWSGLAKAIDAAQVRHGFPSYFDPDPDSGEVFYPEEILKAATRILKKQAPPAETPAPTDTHRP